MKFPDCTFFRLLASMLRGDRPTMTGTQSKGRYSLDDDINQLAIRIVTALEEAAGGEPDFGALRVQKMRKIATLAMKADSNNIERRFRPGNRLRTYTGVRSTHGELLDETYAGEAYLTEQSTIYRNVEPIHYADDEADPARRGLPIRGRFAADGSFVEDVHGPDILFNEYAAEGAEHAKRKYGVTPKPGVWTQGLAQVPSYLVQIPEAKEEVLVRAGGDKFISVKGGDFLVVDVLGARQFGVQAIDLGNKQRTYRTWNSVAA
jgi:hypothetical protein